MLNIICDNDISWNKHQQCQHSCFVTGNGDPGDYCCNVAEKPSTYLKYFSSDTPPTASCNC